MTQIVNHISFGELHKCKHMNTSVAYSEDYILKVEHYKHEKKKQDLLKEAGIIKYLNEKNCISCPKIIETGIMDTGEKYLIEERIKSTYEPILADIIFSILEQKSLGVCQGDIKKENMIGRDNICYLIDYDQGQINPTFSTNNNLDYVVWYINYCKKNWGYDFYRDFDREELFSLFREDGSFNLAKTTLFQRQITTDSVSGIYQSINTPKVFIEGARGLDKRIPVLNTIDFKEGEKILDVGSNSGLLSLYLADRGCIVTGIDMDKNIITGAQMVANILNANVEFRYCDIDTKDIESEYDTICLFSVLHHLSNMERVAKNVAEKANRILLECRLNEQGYKYVNGRWQRTSGWSFKTKADLIQFFEVLFNFRFIDDYGEGDRGRSIYSFRRG